MAIIGQVAESSTEQVHAMWVTDEHGERIDIERLRYQIEREAAPIYAMGNPNPRSFERGRRSLTGRFSVKMEDYYGLSEMNGISLHALSEEAETVVVEVELLDYQFTNSMEEVVVFFTGRRVQRNPSGMELQKRSNRELAKVLLTSAY